MVYALEMDVRHRRANDFHAIDDDAPVELTESGSQGLVAKVKSGNRVIMASRREGIKSEDRYIKNGGKSWSIVDLPELSIAQQSQIAKHQIETLEGPFFDQFFEH